MDRQPELRRAMTLKEQLSTPAEPAIRDFLRIPDDDDDDDGEGAEDRPCTLMDAIDRDVRREGGAGGAINWRPLRHRLWLRRAAGAWHAPVCTTKPAAAANGASPRNSNKYNYSTGEAPAALSRAPSLPAAVNSEEEEAEDNYLRPAPASASASTSLMTLMEQSGGHWDEASEDGGASLCGSVEDNDEDGNGERREEEEEEEVQVCCVCMVRHKGAAFIPCGHTFCRLCSRELRFTRGNCPLCNVFIQDILHIF